MVIDEVGSDRFPRYLVYDIVRFEGLEVGRTDFSTRLTCIEKEIVGARNSYIIAVRLYLHCLLWKYFDSVCHKWQHMKSVFNNVLSYIAHVNSFLSIGIFGLDQKKFLDLNWSFALGNGQLSLNLFDRSLPWWIQKSKNLDLVQGKIDKRSEPFSVRQKQFWDVQESRTLLGPKFTKESLGHEPDGLIFQPAKEVCFILWLIFNEEN